MTKIEIVAKEIIDGSIGKRKVVFDGEQLYRVTSYRRHDIVLCDIFTLYRQTDTGMYLLAYTSRDFRGIDSTYIWESNDLYTVLDTALMDLRYPSELCTLASMFNMPLHIRHQFIPF